MSTRQSWKELRKEYIAGKSDFTSMFIFISTAIAAVVLSAVFELPWIIAVLIALVVGPAVTFPIYLLFVRKNKRRKKSDKSD